MQRFKLSIRFSKSGDYFDYDVRVFDITTDAVRFTTDANKSYSFPCEALYEVAIKVVS